jgi:hypothetical protein
MERAAAVATRAVRFAAGEPGTYLYWATTTGALFRKRAP